MLSPAEKRKLRQDAHHLKPVVLVGQHGLTPAVLAEIDRALFDHELIKVRLRGQDRVQRAAEIGRMVGELGAQLVTSIGAIAVVYRENPERKPARSPS